MYAEIDGDEYFGWLWERTGLGSYYCRLMAALFTTPYVPRLTDDVNRWEDGACLVDIFCEETGIDIGPSDEDDAPECSVLEMLVALAERIDTELIEGEPTNSSPKYWLCMMLSNLGILQMTDRYFEEEVVEERIDEWMNRGIRYLFPPVGNYDQRRVSEWERVNRWLLKVL